MFGHNLLRTGKGGGLGLEIRLALFVVCVVTIMAGIAALAFAASDRGAREAHDRQAGLALAGRLAAELSPFFAAADPTTRQAGLQRALARPAVLRIEIYDRAARAIAVEAKAPQPFIGQAQDVAEVIQRRSAFTRTTSLHVEASVAIFDAAGAAGAVRVLIARAGLPSNGSHWMFGLALAYIAALAIGLPLAIVLARKITTPLRMLTDFSKHLSANHRSERLDIRTGDEFEGLAGAFNAMIARFDESMRRIERLAYRDPATDLANLFGLQRELAGRIRDAVERKAPGVVFLLRIERLSSIIETIGHDHAEDLAACIAVRLRQRVKVIDRLVRLDRANEAPSSLARLGGPDFAVVAPSFASSADAARFAQLLASALSQPIEWREQTFAFGARVGAAIYPRDGEDPDTLIRHAMLAVSAAATEPARARFFTSELERVAARRIAVERSLRAAIDTRAFVAHFQPKVDLESRRVIGAEALARWIQPSGAVVAPGRFIGAAEEFGLIGPISDAVLRDACWKVAAWVREGEAMSVAVNVSPLQFADERFAERIQRTLEETGLPPEHLELEITESVALTDPDRAARLLRPLRDRGVKVALDDFGCGHSSLSALTKLPFDVIKIDQQFVRALNFDPNAPAIIETILTLAGRLGCDVVAEGVETEAEAEWLRMRGCTTAQGYLFGAALPPVDFRRVQLRQQRSMMSPIIDVA